MKVWITKYALTQGIFEADAQATDYPDMIRVRGDYAKGTVDALYHKKEWHQTPQEAEHRAEEMRLAKIKSLEQQLDKMRRLNITAKP